MQNTATRTIFVQIRQILQGDYSRVFMLVVLELYSWLASSQSLWQHSFKQLMSSPPSDEFYYSEFQDFYVGYFQSQSLSLRMGLLLFQGCFYLFRSFLAAASFYLFYLTCLATFSLTSILLQMDFKVPPSLRNISSVFFNLLLQDGAEGMCTLPLGNIGYSVYINLQSKTPKE